MEMKRRADWRAASNQSADWWRKEEEEDLL